MSKLNQGDVVLKRQNGYFVAKMTVARVTATQAILNDGTRLKREHNGDYITEIGAYNWSRILYLFDSEQNRNDWEDQKKTKALKFLATSLSNHILTNAVSIGIERLERVQAIINEQTTNNND